MMPLTMAGRERLLRSARSPARMRSVSIWRSLALWWTADVTVVSEIAGNLILQVKDSRVALDKTMAKPDHDLRAE